MIIGYLEVAGSVIKTISDFEVPGFKTDIDNDINVDIVVEVTQEKIEKIREKVGFKLSKFSCASAIVLEEIADLLVSRNSFLLHSATFEVDGQGIAFSARSGTGKTTHMLNWQKYLGEKLTVINGDKPIIRFFDDEPETPYAYGTPWNGKERFGNDSRTVLRHICFIERDETNFVTTLDKSEAIIRIMKQVYIPKDPIASAKTLSLVHKLLSSCKLWVIHCNMDIKSAEIAYKAIFEKK